MFNNVRHWCFQRVVYLDENILKICYFSSTSIHSDLTMKQLINSNHYEKALQLFDRKSERYNDFDLSMALKACAKLRDYQRGMNIQRQISSRSLLNPFIQTSLIHFYSELFSLI